MLPTPISANATGPMQHRDAMIAAITPPVLEKVVLLICELLSFIVTGLVLLFLLR